MKKIEDSFNVVQNETNNEPKMKNNLELQKAHFAKAPGRLIRIDKTRVGKYMKIFSYMTILTGVLLFFNSCAGYITSEPTYVEYARPQRPSETHIWIDGDWNWNIRSHTYVQKTGYWERPHQGQTYVTGRWQTSSHGKSWTKGYWKNDNQRNKSNNSRNKDRNNNRNH